MATLNGRERVEYVRSMFGRIARRYNLMNRLMTFGRDRAWRRYVVQQAALPTGGYLLDVGVGTGDIALEALTQDSSAKVTGADFTPAMMSVGRRRHGGQRVRWVCADALALPFPAGSFDAVTSGYLMRNVGDVLSAFREQVRVVRPGGRIVCLDTTPPPPGPLRPLVRFYLRAVIPLLGRLVAGDAPAYAYLPASTQAFKTPDELAAIMRKVGLVDVRYRRFMLGTMAVHVGVRPAETA